MKTRGGVRCARREGNLARSQKLAPPGLPDLAEKDGLPDRQRSLCSMISMDTIQAAIFFLFVAVCALAGSISVRQIR